MKKILKVALAAGAALLGTTALTGVANAEVEYSGNVALGTDYVWRGVSQSGSDPAVSGGFDVGVGSFYAGTWASSLGADTGAAMELDVYAGFKPVVGPVTLDLGVIYYAYPAADDDGAEFDFYELKAAGTINPVEALSLTGSLFYSPEAYGETGNSIYVEGAAGYTISDAFAVSGAVGWYDIDEADYDVTAGEESAYVNWNLGGTFTVAGFGLDLRYWDSDIEEDFDTGGIADSSVVFTIKRAM